VQGYNISTVHAMALQLVVSAAGTGAGDTLNVYVQHSVDGGSTYDDFISFTQVLGNGGTKRFEAQWVRDAIPNTPLRAASDGALSPGVILGPVGDNWRIKWVIVDGSSASFTFALEARLLNQRI
jgi:hypothetical protein